MTQRQTREQARLKDFRMLRPGEVEHEVALAQLGQPPALIWDAPTLATCEFLYDRYVQEGSSDTIPDLAFCDLPRWVFLEYLVQKRGALLFGSNNPNLTRLEPVILAQNVHGWNLHRYYAFANSSDALFSAILDTQRLKELDCSSKSTMSWRSAEHSGRETWSFYVGIDYRALPHAPWRPGTVYVYSRSDFPPDFDTIPYQTSEPILPLAKVNVHPWDWPILDQVCGVDVVAQTERQRDTFRGYPWTDDARIHPNQWKRALVDHLRTHLETYYADPIDLPGLGRLIGMSPFAVLRMFRSQVGLSPREYQTHLRIAQAKRLLTSGLPIAQAAAETGFCDQTHLTQHFRRVVGATPGQYLRVQESPIRHL